MQDLRLENIGHPSSLALLGRLRSAPRKLTLISAVGNPVQPCLFFDVLKHLRATHTMDLMWLNTSPGIPLLIDDEAHLSQAVTTVHELTLVEPRISMSTAVRVFPHICVMRLKGGQPMGRDMDEMPVCWQNLDYLGIICPIHHISFSSLISTLFNVTTARTGNTLMRLLERSSPVVVDFSVTSHDDLFLFFLAVVCSHCA